MEKKKNKNLFKGLQSKASLLYHTKLSQLTSCNVVKNITLKRIKSPHRRKYLFPGLHIIQIERIYCKHFKRKPYFAKNTVERLLQTSYFLYILR